MWAPTISYRKLSLKTSLRGMKFDIICDMLYQSLSAFALYLGGNKRQFGPPSGSTPGKPKPKKFQHTHSPRKSLFRQNDEPKKSVSITRKFIVGV